MMVVDDEEAPRILLKKCVNWDELGMEFVCEASGAIEALDMIEEFNPDIIFTDIQMPFIDGLEFSSNVAKTYPNIKIVILTAHKEFDYAQSSIKIGVSDFLLKPINRDEVLKIAFSLKEQIVLERSHWNEYSSLKKQLEENYWFLRDKFLVDMTENSSNSSNITEKMQYFFTGIVPEYYQTALVETAFSDDDLEKDEEKRLMIALGSIEIVKQYFKEYQGIDVFFDNSHRIVVLLTHEDIDLLTCSEQLKSLIINRVKCSIAVGIGNGYRDCKQISLTYREALEALKYSIVSGRNYVICINDDMNFSDQHWGFNTEITNEISFLIKAGLDEKAVNIIKELFSDLTKIRVLTIEQVRVVSINIISAILGAITEMGLGYQEVFGTSHLPYNKVFEIDTIITMKKYIIDLAVSSARTIRALRTRKGKTLTDDIMEYLKNNLSQCELSLSSVAQEFYVNSSYLSRIFKQETGNNFSKYILKLRMERALEILNQTNMKAYQIAEEVGIKDPYYFSNCFKKFTGLSVNDYKNRNDSSSI